MKIDNNISVNLLKTYLKPDSRETFKSEVFKGIPDARIGYNEGKLIIGCLPEHLDKFKSLFKDNMDAEFMSVEGLKSPINFNMLFDIYYERPYRQDVAKLIEDKANIIDGNMIYNAKNIAVAYRDGELCFDVTDATNYDYIETIFDVIKFGYGSIPDENCGTFLSDVLICAKEGRTAIEMRGARPSREYYNRFRRNTLSFDTNNRETDMNAINTTATNVAETVSVKTTEWTDTKRNEAMDKIHTYRNKFLNSLDKIERIAEVVFDVTAKERREQEEREVDRRKEGRAKVDRILNLPDEEMIKHVRKDGSSFEVPASVEKQWIKFLDPLNYLSEGAVELREMEGMTVEIFSKLCILDKDTWKTKAEMNSKTSLGKGLVGAALIGLGLAVLAKKR